MTGSTYSISFLADGLANKGHNVYMGGHDDSLLFSILKNTKVNLVPMRFKSKTDLETMKCIRDVVNEKNIQIINAQSGKDRYLTIFAKWLFNLNVKIVHTRRQRPLSSGGWLQKMFYVQTTEKIIVVSDELKNIFIRKGYPPDHLKVIYNGTPSSQYQNINQKRIDELRKLFDINENNLVIGCVARMKEQHQLVKALKYLDKDIKVVFAGIPVGSLDDVVQQTNVENRIVYAGNLSHDDVFHLYKIMTVHVLPSTMEGFSLTLLEAMALGTPVVGTRSSGIVNAIEDGYNGLLYENENVSELADKIKAVLYNKDLRQKLIENGKVTALEKFSVQKTVENYEKFFLSLLDNQV
jgi:glycosyltransferase involved in cell wall biosynthesis